MENGRRPPVDWEKFKETATVIKSPDRSVGRINKRKAVIRGADRGGTIVGGGRPQGASGNRAAR
jgi:hypothetical protein